MSHSDNSFMQSHFFTFSPSFTSWRMPPTQETKEALHANAIGEVTSASNGCEGWQAHTQNSLLG